MHPAVTIGEAVWRHFKLGKRLKKVFLKRALRRASKRGETIVLESLKEDAQMKSDQVLGIVRHVLTTLGGSLVTAGVVSESELQAVVGGIVVVLGVLWSIYQKRAAK